VIRSMTGFGRASLAVGGVSFDLEVRSVNHRHLDARARLPRLLGAFEHPLRERIQQSVSRGKVDLSVTTPDAGGPPTRLEVDLDAARQYVRAAEELRVAGVAGELDVRAVLSLPGVSRFVEPELEAGELELALDAAVEEGLAALDAMRVAEGASLERDLRGRLARVSELADALEARSGDVQEAARERLRKRSEQLGLESGVIDEGRLHQEIVMAADRLDVTEEVVRLRSHVEQFGAVIDSGGPGAPVGRRLDFLMQEMGREANTIGSKGSDAPIAHAVVELKTELERIREQVQNVE